MIEEDFSKAAKLLSDPARAKIVLALMSGKAHTATELSIEANVTAQTASSHLSKLVTGNFLVERKQGRHKYFQIVDPKVAEIVENLLNFSANNYCSNIETGPINKNLRTARVCYDHLAGELSILIFEALLRQNYITDAINTKLTKEGEAFFSTIGFDISLRKKSSRPNCRSCLDWSERKSHLAGSVGQWVLNDILFKNWARRDMNSRSLLFSQSGLTKLSAQYKIGPNKLIPTLKN